MNLLILSDKIDPLALESIAELTCARSITPVGPQAFRLLDAQPHEALPAWCEAAAVDHVWIAADRHLSDFGLFVTDMDSTLIDIECIDEIADMQGLKPQVAEITEAAMRGEIDFRESLTRRVGLLAGLHEEALEEVYSQRLHLNPGAELLMQGLQQANIRTVLVSGGFTYFTERLQRRLGFDHAYANQLEVDQGRLTGRVVGDIVDGEAKAAHLIRIRDELGLAPAQVIAAGDGANDIPMLQAAGFGVAFRAKPVLRTVADCSLDHSGLDGILSLFA